MMNKVLLTGLSALLLLAACEGGKLSQMPAGTEAAKGLTDKEERMLRVADSTRTAGDREAAKKLYREIIALSKGSVVAHLQLAAMLSDEGNMQEALKILTEAETLQSDNAEVLRNLANTMIALGNPTDAITKLDKAIAITDSDPKLYNSKAVALDMKEQYKESQEMFKKAIALAPETSTYIENNLAISYILTNNLDEAIALLAKNANSANATPMIRQNLAIAYGLAGQADKSLEWSLKDLSPEKAAENQKIFADLAEKSGAGFKKPDTSVTPVTVIDSPLPEILPDLTPAQKEALKEAVDLMKKGVITEKTAHPAPTAKPDQKPEDKSLPAIGKPSFTPVTKKPAPAKEPTKPMLAPAKPLSPIAPVMPAVKPAVTLPPATAHNPAIDTLKKTGKEGAGMANPPSLIIPPLPVPATAQPTPPPPAAVKPSTAP